MNIQTLQESRSKICSSHKTKLQLNYDRMNKYVYDFVLDFNDMPDNYHPQLRVMSKLQILKDNTESLLSCINSILGINKSSSEISVEDLSILNSVDPVISNKNSVDPTTTIESYPEFIDSDIQDAFNDTCMNSSEAKKKYQKSNSTNVGYLGSDHIQEDDICDFELMWMNKFLDSARRACSTSGTDQQFATKFYKPINIHSVSKYKEARSNPDFRQFHTAGDYVILWYIRNWTPESDKDPSSFINNIEYIRSIRNKFPSLDTYFNDLHSELRLQYNLATGNDKHKYNQSSEAVAERKKIRSHQKDLIQSACNFEKSHNDFRNLSKVTPLGLAFSRIREMIFLRYSCNSVGSAYYYRTGQLIKNLEALIWEQGNLFYSPSDRVRSYDFDLQGNLENLNSYYTSRIDNASDRSHFSYAKFWQLATMTYSDRTFCFDVDKSDSNTRTHGPVSYVACSFLDSKKNERAWTKAYDWTKLESEDNDITFDSSDKIQYVVGPTGTRLSIYRGAVFGYTLGACYIAYKYMKLSNNELVTWDEPTDPNKLSLRYMLRKLKNYGSVTLHVSKALEACIQDNNFVEEHFQNLLKEQHFNTVPEESKLVFKYLFIHTPSEEHYSDYIADLGGISHNYDHLNVIGTMDSNPTSLYAWRYCCMTALRPFSTQLTDRSAKRRMVYPKNRITSNEYDFARWIDGTVAFDVPIDRYNDWKACGAPGRKYFFSVAERAKNPKLQELMDNEDKRFHRSSKSETRVIKSA